VKFYRGSASAARAYLEADHSRADEYYLAEGSGLATRYTASPGAGGAAVARADVMDGPTYERWVAGYQIDAGADSGAAKGRLREDANALRFVEVVVNGPKTWSLAAALHPEVSEALDHAQDRAAEQIIGWLAEHATTRIGPRGRQVQVPVEQIEAAVIRHYTSRAGDPHRHLHLQVNARVFAEGKWRGLHSVGVRDMVAAINGIGHAAVATDPEFRATLTAHGFTMNPADGELVELAPYVGQFSARTAQIGRNIDRYKAEWRADHPGQEPGPRLRLAWDRRAWAEHRPDKPRPDKPHAGTPSGNSADRSFGSWSGPADSAGPTAPIAPADSAEMVTAWNALLHQLGYRDPSQTGLPIALAGPSAGVLDRDEAAGLVISRLGAARSAWNAADIRGGVEEWIATTGLVADPAVRIELAEDITARALAMCVPLLDAPGVPEHVRGLTSPHVLAVEADLVTAIADRAANPTTPAALHTSPSSSGLDAAQHNAVRILAGDARLVVVEGAAGAGKTTTLAALGRELEQQGRRLVVVTPTLKAAQVANTELDPAPGTQARSAAALVRAYGWRWDEDGHWTHHPNETPATTILRAGDLLLVDEVGMLDQDTARALFHVADQTGARVALVGDRHQLPAVGRGGVLDLAARWAAPETVIGLDVVHRFTDPDYADISLAMRRGEDVFDQLWARGQIRLHASENERLHAIGTETADQLATKNPCTGACAGESIGEGAGQGIGERCGVRGVVVMADSRAQVAALNGVIRDRLVAIGHVDDADARVVVTDAGERIGVGDQVATRLNNRDLGVANRDLWTVTAINPDGALILTPATDQPGSPAGKHGNHQRAREVPASYVRGQVELAYATTVYGAQGETTGIGHMLIAETTTGSAAYVGMTRGREENIAHIVADDKEQARVVWDGVMGRDRADLGPGHARQLAAEEMDRYAPQRPLGVVLERLRAAWTTEADLTVRHERLDQGRQHLHAVQAICNEYGPRHEHLRQRFDVAMSQREHAEAVLRDLENTLTTQTQRTVSDLWRRWQDDQPSLRQALHTIHDGPGHLGLRRRTVRDARDVVAAWADRWRPLLPELPTDPDQLIEEAGRAVGGIGQAQVRDAFGRGAEHATEQAHPEAHQVREQARVTALNATAAREALTGVEDDLVAKLRPYGRLAYQRDLGDALASVEADLAALTPHLDAATQKVQALIHAPEIRSLPAGRLGTERDQWASDRHAAQEAARAAALQKAAFDQAQQADAQARRRLHPSRPTPTHGQGPTSPGIGF